MNKKELVESKSKTDLALYNSYQQLKAIATDLHKSGLFTHLKKPEQAIAVVEYGRELGIPPMQALQTMAVINGKIGMEAKLLMGLAKRAGYDMEILKSTNKECEINFITPKGKTHKVSFDIEEAKQMGLSGKDNWKKQPANMLVQRCMAKAVRRHAPETMLDDGSGMGMYTIEELSGGDVETVEELQDAEFEEVKEEKMPEKEERKKRDSLPEIIELKEKNRTLSFTVDRFLTKEEQQYYMDKGTSDNTIALELRHRFNLVSYYAPKNPEVFSELRKIRVGMEDRWDDWKTFAKDKDFKFKESAEQMELIKFWKEGEGN